MTQDAGVAPPQSRSSCWPLAWCAAPARPSTADGPTSVAIQPDSSATTASGPATTAEPQEPAVGEQVAAPPARNQNTTTTSASSVPMPDHRLERQVRDVDRRPVGPRGSCPARAPARSNEFLAMIDPSRGMLDAPSDLAVDQDAAEAAAARGPRSSSASSNAASLDGCVSPHAAAEDVPDRTVARLQRRSRRRTGR